MNTAVVVADTQTLPHQAQLRTRAGGASMNTAVVVADTQTLPHQARLRTRPEVRR